MPLTTIFAVVDSPMQQLERGTQCPSGAVTVSYEAKHLYDKHLLNDLFSRSYFLLFVLG
jgi:hypothetical protein